MTDIPRLTQVQMASLGYNMAELRQLSREHRVIVPRDALHHELVRALIAAGVELPPKRGA